MNHVFMIIAHKMPDLLFRSMKHLEAENHYFIVNIDRKADCQCQFYDGLKKIKNVIKITNFSVAHAGVTQVTTTLHQMQYCVEYPVHFDYYHLISGQDYPVVSNRLFDQKFETDMPYSYLRIDTPEELTVWRKSKYPKRLNRYYLFDLIQNKFLHKTKIFSVLNHLAQLFPREKFNDFLIWGGWQWFSLHDIAVRYILQYLKNNPGLIKRLKYTSCCDELVFNSILMEQHKLPIVSDNDFRYVDWHPRRAYRSLPLILNEEDYDDIVNSGMLFCRKVELGESDRLLEMLDEKINSEK
ncbi:beta-1,6-N-acetylglucosaminyltransferase [Mitsuokella jalaludinii]|uniref:beta-1,6-N-acetylglucosaminyltransferase n=1 Tax=Mitsuokella jalaludinii TaxID=187979 RepID=UPI0034C66F4C